MILKRFKLKWIVDRSAMLPKCRWASARLCTLCNLLTLCSPTWLMVNIAFLFIDEVLLISFGTWHPLSWSWIHTYLLRPGIIPSHPNKIFPHDLIEHCISYFLGIVLSSVSQMMSMYVVLGLPWFGWPYHKCNQSIIFIYFRFDNIDILCIIMLWIWAAKSHMYMYLGIKEDLHLKIILYIHVDLQMHVPIVLFVFFAFSV